MYVALLFIGCDPTPAPGDVHLDVQMDDAVSDAETDTATDTNVEDTADDLTEDAAEDIPTVRRCNGIAELCGRPLDQVAFVTTHNSMANETDGFFAPNQKGNISQQLADGVRAFMLDIHYDNREDPPVGTEVYLCHGVCALGMRPLEDTLREMKTFLEDNPDEFVAIIFESYVSAEHAKVSFDAAGATDMLADLSPDDETPTLAELIDSGNRILVLTDSDGGGFPGYLPVWDWAWDNDWDNKVPEDLNCDVNRGSGANRFFILNHFLTDPFASAELAAKVNFNPFFKDQVDECNAARDHKPNFVTVDFYDVGDVFDVVENLNLTE